MRRRHYPLLMACILMLALALPGMAHGTLQAGWTTTNHRVAKTDGASAMKACNTATLKLAAWRGERIHASLLAWTGQHGGELKFQLEEPAGQHWADATTTGFVRYVMTDELNKDGSGGCGYRPDKTQFDSLMVADRIEPATTLDMEPETPCPLWITFDIPHDAAPGLYKGSVTLTFTPTGGEPSAADTRTLHYSIRVSPLALPAPGERKFHLDLWQNPFAVARMAGTPLWSKEHLEAMRPLMERLARAGQRGITATITHKPWNGQTYDYFENMITEIKKADGSWSYDYTVLDRWVEFMRSCGVGPYIYCYSVIPWKLTFRYYDQATNAMTDCKLEPTDPAFDAYWVPKLKALAQHLKQKGWFEHTVIAMDERPKESMEAALRVIRAADPDYKISLAGNYHETLQPEIFDYCIPYGSRYPQGVPAARREAGKLTTFYTCCSETFPNTFTFSQPVEAAAYGPIARQRGLDGYLRWAYNSWVEDPCNDSRFTAWAAGDTYLVYPMNQSSVRFEKLIEGIQLYEKMAVLSATARHDRALSKLLAPFAQGELGEDAEELTRHIVKLAHYLNAAK